MGGNCSLIINQIRLSVSAPDPEYGFKKKLEAKKHGETKKAVKLKCKVDDPNARVKWYKDGQEIKPSDQDYLMEVCSLKTHYSAILFCW